MQPSVVVLRVLGERIEPVMSLLVQVRAACREAGWGLMARPLRIRKT